MDRGNTLPYYSQKKTLNNYLTQTTAQEGQWEKRWSYGAHKFDMKGKIFAHLRKTPQNLRDHYAYQMKTI